VILPAIELNSLYRRYGRQQVLININLVVDSGRIVSLVGGNGAGKTTLLRVLTTRLRPSHGTGLIFGADLVSEAHIVRRRVMYLSAAGGNSPTLTARENLTFSAKVYGTPVQDADRILEIIGLTKAADRTVRTFSSGMKKRLGIGRLLLTQADLWLLDEPYSGLDQDGVELVNNLLSDAQEHGRTVIMASHNIENLTHSGEAVLELVNGRLRKPSSEVKNA
jgi:heme ABC exporter ATP-binding subunit CcmA